eukprot:Em0002g891a
MILNYRYQTHALGLIHWSPVEMNPTLIRKGSQCFIPNGIDIIFDSVVVPVSSIFAFCEKPAELIRWIATTSSFARFDTQVDQRDTPHLIGEERTRSKTLQCIEMIQLQPTEAGKAAMSKEFGSRDVPNFLLHIPADLYKSIPVEVLHTILLGLCKYFLKEVMPRLSKAQKKELLARIRAFNLSGFQDKVHDYVCNHFKSFVGRDFKAWAQMAIFILSKQRRIIAYCCHFKLSDAEEWQQLCEEFVKNVKDYMPALLKKQKVHTILHLVECMISYGPSSAFSAERCESFNGSVRMQNIYGNKQAPSRDIANHFACIEYLRFICEGGVFNAGERCGSGLQELYKSMQVQQFLNFVPMKELNKVKISELLAMVPPFNVLIMPNESMKHQKITTYKAVVSTKCTLVHSGDYVELCAPSNEREEVKELLDGMLERQVIEPSQGSWSSPVVLVKKKDGSTRFCVDFRQLNTVTKKDAQPLPRIDETLDVLGSARWFSCLDLTSGYWQVEVAPEDREKMAFVTPYGLFQFRVMPFGLTNAPATIQRLMERVLAGLHWTTCLIYLDDILIFSATVQQHFTRRFVRNFAAKVAPLVKLTEKGHVWHWSSDCDAAFLQLKERLVTSPILGYPVFNQPFMVDTDASGEGLGAVLSQYVSGVERVIAFASRSLSKAERKYCATRREMLALVCAIKHFRPYLYDRRFTVRTDHASLRWLQSFHEPEGQVARWLECLSEYDFEVVHRPGTKHTNADALSRMPCPQCQLSFPQVCTMQSDIWLPCWTLDELAEEQRQDSSIGQVIQWMENDSIPRVFPKHLSSHTQALWAQSSYLVLQNGVLYRRWEDVPCKGLHRRLQLVLPPTLVPVLLEALHSSIRGGHFGTSKTLAKEASTCKTTCTPAA